MGSTKSNVVSLAEWKLKLHLEGKTKADLKTVDYAARAIRLKKERLKNERLTNNQSIIKKLLKNIERI